MRTIRYGTLLALVLLVVVAGTSWGQDNPESLFKPAAPPANASTAYNESGLPRRYVTLDTSLLSAPSGEDGSRGDALQLELLNGDRYVAVADSIQHPAEGRSIWHGKITGEQDGLVTLVVRDGVVAGSIRAGDRLYRLTYGGDGVHLLEEVPAAEPTSEHPPIPVTEEMLSAGSPAAEGSNQTPSNDNGSQIDVLVVYTTKSRQRYGQAGIESLIDLAVAETNSAYQNSQINTRLSLVGTAEIGYSESGNMLDDLYRLQRTGDGFMEQVHGWRDSLAADTVTLIEEASDFCGIAFLMTSLAHSFESHAFSVVDSDCATGYYSFGHELGHNMGSTHDRANGGDSLYPYSFGFWAPDYSFRTIMAYNCPGGCLRVRHFSNPDVSYNGQPTGIAYAINPPQAADNTRSINQASYTVANWRDSATRGPGTPTSLTAAAESPTRIDLSWTDQANGELGFHLQRRIAGQTWARIADLGPNTTSYQDIDLMADTTYEYRVRSYTEDQTSDYSNVADATTPRHPELHVGQLVGGGSIKSGSSASGHVWQANVIIGVHDAYHDPVSGATVRGQWSGGASGSSSCLTDGSGNCLVTKPDLAPGISSVTFTINEISHGSEPYVPDHNHGPDGDGTTITLSKPTGVSFLPMTIGGS